LEIRTDQKDPGRRDRVRIRVKKRRKRRRTGRRIGIILLLTLTAVIALGILALFPAADARSDLLEARAMMEDARSALLRGDPREAGGAFGQAQTKLLEAQEHLQNPAIQLLGYLPILGRSPDATEALVTAGVQVTRAGKVVADAVEDLPGGVSALAPRDGRIPLRPLRQLSVPLSRVSGLLEEAGSRMAASPQTLLIPPVREGVEEFAPLLEEAQRGAASAAALTRHLPAFLGARETKRYFVGAQNPAEQRGTGGLIGAYAILTARNGHLDFGDFRSIGELSSVQAESVEAPNPQYAVRYDRFQSRGDWSNINMTPDFPSAAVAMERLYEETEGVELDGTIVVDPFSFSALLEVTGSVEVPTTGYRLNARNVVDYVTNRAYTAIPGNERKQLLGDAAEEVISRFIGGPVGSRTTEEDLGSKSKPSKGGQPGGDRSAGGEGSKAGNAGSETGAGSGAVEEASPGLEGLLGEDGEATAAAGRALVETAAGGHLLFHSTDPQIQQAFRIARVAGELAAGDGDFLAVVLNNSSGTKLDFYMDRSIDYEVQLQDGGGAVADTEVKFTNHAPRTGQPTYVIGPHPFVPEARAGESVSYLSTFCAPSCSAQNLWRDGRLEGAIREQELGYRVLSTGMEIESGESESIRYAWSASDVWEGGPGHGVYRLTLVGQSTIRPVSLRVDIQAPEGAHITATSPRMAIIGNRAVWEGEAGDRMIFEVSFARGPFGALWHGLLQFLQEPVVRVG
jgi:Protein of unknown function (DUF4012)